MQFGLRTLLIMTAVMPPLLAVAWTVLFWIVKNPATSVIYALFFIAYLLAIAIAVRAKRTLRAFLRLFRRHVSSPDEAPISTRMT